MKFLRSLKLEELEQRVVPAVLLAGVPGQDTLTFTDFDGDLVRIEFGNLFNPLGATSGSATILNSDGLDPGTAGNPDIDTIIFSADTGDRTDFDIEVIGGSGDGSVEIESIVAPARLRQIRITGNVDTAALFGFDTSAVTEYLHATFLTRGLTGDVDRMIITGGDLGVTGEANTGSPEVVIDLAGRLGELIVSGGIGDGAGFVTIDALDSIGDISAEYFGQGRIETPGNLHSLTLSGDYTAGGAPPESESDDEMGGLYVGSLGDSATGSGGILCQAITGTIIGGKITGIGYPTYIDIAGDCYANITALDEISGEYIFVPGDPDADPPIDPNEIDARVFITIEGDVGPLATISSGGTFANYTSDVNDFDGDGDKDEMIVDIENPPLWITGDLKGRVVSHLQGNTDFDTEYFVFNLNEYLPTFALRGHAATSMDIVAGGDAPNAASIEVFGSALAVSVENIDVYSFSNTQQIRDILFNQDIVGAVTISHGIPDHGSLKVRNVFGFLTIVGGVEVDGDVVVEEDVLGLTVIGDSSGQIEIGGNALLVTFNGNLAGNSAAADDLMKLEASNFGIINIHGNVGEFVQMTATGEIALLQVSGSFQSSYYDSGTGEDVYTLDAGNVKFAKIDEPISGEVTALLHDTPNLRTKVEASHIVHQESFDEAQPGSLHIIDDSGNSQFLRISGGRALVNLLPTENGNVITRIEVISGKPSIELYGAEVGHILNRKSLGSVYLDPVLFVRGEDGEKAEYDFGGGEGEGGEDSHVYTIESREGGIGNIYSGGGDIVRVLSEKSVGKIYAGIPKLLGVSKPPEDFDFASYIAEDSDVGLLEMYDGHKEPIRDLTGVYIANGNIRNVYSTGDIANFEIFGNARDIRAAVEKRQVSDDPSAFDNLVPWGTVGGGSLRGFFDIDGKVRDIGALNDIDVQYINVGKNIRDIEARGGDIKAEQGITAASSIRNVEAGFYDVRKRFAPAGDVLADITSVNGNIKKIRGMNITGDISANKKISEVHADFNIGRNLGDGVYEGSIYAGKLRKIYADNDIYADITCEKNASRIIANYDDDIRGGIYGDIDIGGKAGRIEAYEDITGNIYVGNKCSRLISENGSFTGDITIGKLSRWELKSDSIEEISGIVDIDKLSRLKGENAVISGNITLGKLSKEFNTREADPVVISGAAPFEFLFVMGNPDGTLIIETGNGKTIDRIK